MKVSLNWIRDYVQLPADADLKKLAYDLTMSTVEVEDTIELAKQFDHMVVGVINTIEQHPNADKLRVCMTDIGGRVESIVCGGSNLREGMKVAVALPGSVCRWHGEGEPVEIKKSKLRGVDSYGMICGAVEIGLADLFPTKEEAHILDLSDFDAPAGTPLADALDLNDIILEIDNKSMTNRPDLWGHYGIAREIAALYDLPMKEFPHFDRNVENTSGFHVTVEDAERCPRMTGTQIENVCVKPAPYWMQVRIWKTGMRPINALVDITNYVMLATGQPSHAYDSDHIAGHIIVRRAKAGETLTLLNGKELPLSTDDLTIADDAGIVGLAGVMGGAKDSILPTTSKVILEIANFQAAGIRRTALRYDNRTEASARYEKAIDPERCDQALDLSMQLFSDLYPEMKVTGLVDEYPQHLKQAEIDVPLSWLERRLGKRLPPEEIRHKMELLGYGISFDGDNMHVVVPTWRSTGDVSIQADIMEEVARMYGYENFEAEPITTTFDGAINQLDKDLERRIKEYLAIRCGMQEIFTYPWMEESYVNAVLQSTEGILSLSTPPSPAERFVRSSLLPNLCKAVVKNERYFDEFSIFETAQVFRDENYTSPYDPREKLPSQRKNVAGAFVTTAKDITALFRKAKGVVEMMARYVHMEALTFRQTEKPVWADNVVWLNIYRGEEKVGDLALLSKKVSMACGIKNLNVMLFQLDQDSLVPLKSRTNTFTHMAEYPMTDYDISLLLDGSVQWKDVLQTIGGIKSELLHGASFVDEYRGKQVPAGKKSLTLRLSIGSKEKTLTSSEIEEVASNVLNKIVKRFGAELRR
ncbi:MAG: phenylalanine--tRNA ligase subunit beta [Vescimonas sp.]|uniref:phenylalanine--tRNA ligase subunit beta n=1 Tax=Vescimonas sp. TaxID=2892404 RepID=UPI002A9191C5|nr:phenylalanine--tRNA ligase subunit beta [Vescimonas sp.]MDY5334652.1 phenylalanine--tRNA ligase subunit beta [Vescimonas sp.]